VICIVNAIEGEQVAVDFGLYENQMIFGKGKEIARAEIDGSLSDARIMENLVQFLQQKVRDKALKSGLIPPPSQTVGEVSFDKLFEVLRRIKEVGRTAQVRVTARQDVWTGGPLDIDFHVSRAT